ncbi:MAG: hypothetical protein DMG67_09930, partial [Acidobacteria bacterium]
MQRASLPEPPHNLLIIGRNLDDVYSGKQPGTAIRRTQLFIVMGKQVIGDLFSIGADAVRFMFRFMIAAKQCGF